MSVSCIEDDGVVRDSDRFDLCERGDLTMETLGLSLAEGKALLDGVQGFVVAQQAAEDLARRRHCSHCGERHTSKGDGVTTVRTLFGPAMVPNPRWNRCSCPGGPKTFRPTAAWLRGRTSPELLYIETKWGSLLPYAKVADLLGEVLPVGGSLNHETVRKQLHAVAQRLELELGDEQASLIEGSDDEWEQLPAPDGPMTVGIDGGYVRAAHKQGCFEVIAGKSVVAFRRDSDEAPAPKSFGFVQVYDTKPRRRLWELLRSQGMQENQEVVFFSDGGDDVRQVQEYLHPFSEHIIDWFHITMRLTVLQQMAKTLQAGRPEGAERVSISRKLESIKHYLWHGNVEQALERMFDLSMDLAEIQPGTQAARKLRNGLVDFETYIRNNRDFIPNFGERYRNGETISTAFVESRGRRQALREEAADALVPSRRPPSATDPDEGPQQRARSSVRAVVPRVPCQGRVTPDLLLLSTLPLVTRTCRQSRLARDGG